MARKGLPRKGAEREQERAGAGIDRGVAQPETEVAQAGLPSEGADGTAQSGLSLSVFYDAPEELEHLVNSCYGLEPETIA